MTGRAARADGTQRAAPAERPDSARRTVTVFVSYSRREFHFAEAATATLRSHGALDPWIDVQRLRPGMDWAKALDESLENADALLLLASPAAIASAYVRREWARALERGIPIYIGVVEAVDLPDELAGFPVHDLRTRFWRRAAALGEAIAEARAEPAGAVPRPTRLGLPRRMPAPVAATAALSALASIALVWATALLVGVDIAVMRLARNPFSGIAWMEQGNALEVLRTLRWERAMFMLLGLTALAAPLVPSVLVAGARLLRRRSSRALLLTGFGATAAVGSVLFTSVWTIVGSPAPADVVLTKEVFPTPPEMTAAAATLRALLAGAVVCAVAGGIVVLRSRTLHLWLPTGAGVDHHRRRIAGMRPRRVDLRALKGYDLRLLAEWKGYDLGFLVEWKGYCARLAALPEPNAPSSVEVLCLAPADEAVAGLIRAACRDAGMADGPSPAQWVLVLVSSQASWPETTRAVQELGPRAICVLLDTVRLPSDAEELRRHQWLDFRERLADSLFHLLCALRSPEAEPAGEGLAPTPVVANRFLAPAPARQFVALCRNIASFFPGFALVTLVFRPLDGQSAALAAVTALLVVCLVRLGNRVATRRITAARFRRSYLVAWAVSMLWAGVAISVLWTPVTISTVYGSTSYLPKDNGRTAVELAAGLALLPALIAALFAYYFLLRGQWLPLAVAPANSRLSPFGVGTWTGFAPLSATPGILFALLIELLVEYPP